MPEPEEITPEPEETTDEEAEVVAHSEDDESLDDWCIFNNSAL
jgi:hypothetical protein